MSLLLFRHGPKSPGARLVRAASSVLSSTLSPSEAAAAAVSGVTWHLPLWPAAAAAAVRRAIDLAGPVLLMYLPVHVFFSLWASSFVLLPPHVALGGWVTALALYYGATSRGEPAHTGGPHMAPHPSLPPCLSLPPPLPVAPLPGTIV